MAIVSLLHIGFHMKEFMMLCALWCITACIFHCFFPIHFYNMQNADETKYMLRDAESHLSPVFVSFVFPNALN